jgi:hypothetical protein
MALIALTYIGCIIYQALGTVLMCAMFCRWQREKKLDVFFPPKKAKMFAGRCTTSQRSFPAIRRGKKVPPLQTQCHNLSNNYIKMERRNDGNFLIA